jgi:hypothetical protein
MKKTPEANPNWAALRPRSSFMPLGAANPIAVRSRKLMKNIKAMNGTRRTMTLRMVDCSRVVRIRLLRVVSTSTPTSVLGMGRGSLRGLNRVCAREKPCPP